jgi:hypothetical protein
MARTVLTITSQLFDEPEQEVSVRENLPVRVLLTEAREEFTLAEGNYVLAVKSSGKVLDPDKTLEQLGIQTGAVLELSRERRPAIQESGINRAMPARTPIDSANKAYLRDSNSGTTFDLVYQPAIIGRPDSNNPASAEMLAVNLGPLEGSKSVSRFHARVTEQRGQFFIEPLAEHNPLYLNGALVREGEKLALQPGDKIRVGTFTLLFGTRLPTGSNKPSKTE